VASDYTIIMSVRHRSGDAKADPGEHDADWQAPFVGAAGDFSFSCPNIDTAQGAMLQFEYRGAEQLLRFPDPEGNPKDRSWSGCTMNGGESARASSWFGEGA
jgi:hypothetical protein